MKQRKYLFFLMFALLLSGCINYEEDLQLNADGSGTMIMHYSIPQQLHAMMELGQGSEQDQKDEMPFKFKEADIRADMQAPGVTVEKVETKPEGDQQHYYVHVTFKKVTDLNQTKPFAKMQFEWREEGDQVVFQHTLEGDKNKKESDPMGDQMANAMLGNARFKFKVTLPAKALPAPDTNGTIQEDGKTVVWDYPLLEASKGQVMTAKFEKGGFNLPLSMPMLALLGGGVVVAVIALIIILVMARRM